MAPRIPLVDRDDPSTSPETAALLAQIAEGWGLDLNILKAMANNEEMVKAYVAFFSAVFADLPELDRELAYLTVSVVNECHY